MKYSVFRYDSTWYNNAGTSQSEIILYDNGNIQVNHGILAVKSGVYTGISAGDNSNDNYFTTDGTDYSTKSYIYYRNSGTIIPTTNTGQPFYTTSSQTQTATLTSGQSETISYVLNASGSIGVQTIFTRATSQASSGIRAQSQDLTVAIQDGQAPTATLQTPTDSYVGIGSEKTFNFDVNLQDDTQLNSATLFIYNNLGQIIYQNQTSVSGNNTNTNWNFTFTAAGDYKWNVLAEDLSLHTSWASNGNFSIQINIPTIELNYITQPGTIDIIQTIPKQVTMQVKCYGGDCGNVNLSMLQQTFSSEYQDFEIDFGTWVNVMGDDANWTRKTGASGSTGTGPYFTGDTTSSQSGANYVYTEASNPNFPSKTFLLEKSGLSLTDEFNVDFWYHMYGVAMGNLYYQVFDNGAWQTVWQKTGNQGQTWFNQTISYTPTGTVTALRFNVLTGSDYKSDVALDDILYSYPVYYPLPETTISKPFSINSTYNYQILNMLDGETKNISFYIFENGTINQTQDILFELKSQNFSEYNEKSNISTLKINELVLPELNVQRIQPISNSSLAYKGGQFDLVYNVSCSSVVDCSNINLTLGYSGLDSIGESGSLSLQNNEQKIIQFNNRYSQTPVILAVPTTDNLDDNNPLVPIIHSINLTHATISLCEDAGLTTCSTDTELEELNYFIYDINKSNNYSWIDVGYVNNKQSNGVSSSFNFGKTFTNIPYIFSQSQTYQSASNQIGTHTWLPSKTTTTANLVACDHPGTGDVCAGTFTDTIGYVAIDVVLANLIGLNFGTVDIIGSNWTPISFIQNYTNPTIMLNQNSESEAQDPQYSWVKDLTTTGSQIRYCEADGANYCDSHSAETMVWISLEEGFIQVNNTIVSDISTIQDSVPVYINQPQTNPNQLDLTAQTSTLVSFPLFFIGNFNTAYEIFDTNNFNVQSSPVNVTILYSDFNIDITSPLDGGVVIVNDTFQIKANLTCSGFCGEITISARENNTILTNIISSKIYSLEENNLVCNPGIDGTCIVTWIVNVNDIIGNTYNLDVLFSSDILGDKDTQNIHVDIVDGPGVKFETQNLNIIDVIANYQSQSLDTNITPYINSQTNLSVLCVYGDCNFITSNFTQNSDIIYPNLIGIKFTCLPDTAGSYSALFNLTSNEDSIPDTINVSCTASELDLYVNLIFFQAEIKFDVEQNKTTQIDFNITCNIPGGCLNTELGLYYLENDTENLVSTTPAQTPYFTTSTNPQTLNLTQGTITTVSYTINATGIIDEITNMSGLLQNGIGSKSLPVRTIGKNILQFNQTDLVFDQVYQDEFPGVKSSNLFSRYDNINTNITCISGNCSTFSTSWTNGNDLFEGQIQNINFICDDLSVGNFSATFNVQSQNSQITNQIDLTCNVESKLLDIDFNSPAPKTQNDVIVYQTEQLQFNVTCKTIGGCSNVGVSAKYFDELKTWWNYSWEYRHPITITSSVNAPTGYQLLITFNESNIGPNFDWANYCSDLRFVKSNIIELNYWIESCDLASKTAQIWVKADEALTIGSPYIFEMYYSNTDVISKSNANSVFKSDSIFYMAGKCT
jgi:hypothetical protein